MRYRCLAALLAVLLLSRHAAAVPVTERPRLAVVVVIDQLAMMQLDRYEDLLRPDGFRRLLRDGVVARDARYMGAPTLTAHGHSTLATGAYADRHGIVGNEWWERGSGLTYACHDPNYKLLTRETLDNDGTAPTQLRVPTFADALRLSHPGARVVSLSLKGRGSILFGGAKPEAAIWYDARSDRWTTSTYYGKALPAWVPTGSVSGSATTWDRAADERLCALLPRAERPQSAADCTRLIYERRAGPDNVDIEKGDAGFGSTFPHALAPTSDLPKRGKMFMSSPLADEALFSLALKAIDAEQLGVDDIPDLLFISASAFDLLGHDFGPESQEALDALLREDASLARLFGALDEKVGRGRYVFALAADHGIRPTPLRAAQERQNAGMMDPQALVASAESALDAAFGPRDYLSPIANVGISFRENALQGIDRARADAVVVDALRKQPGVANVFPRALFMSQLALRGDAAFFARSYFDGRSPDFIIDIFPGWAWEDVASHGMPYLSEQRIPFMFYRGDRGPMSVEGTVDAASLTPTLALILGSAPPVAAEAPILTRVVDQLR